MSKTKTEEQKNNRRDIELPPNVTNQAQEEVVVEPSEAEKLLEASRPYWAQIALAVCALVLGYVLINTFLQNSRNSAANSWQQLDLAISQFRINQNVDSLKQVAEEFPNDKAGNWAMQIAGDYELNRGLEQLAVDREGGMKLIKRAKESLEQVVAAPNTSKTTMQQQRSLFMLAYANESLGEFDTAKELYEKYTQDAPDSMLYGDAERGLKRVTNPDFKNLYAEFTKFKPFDEEAPGAAIEDVPNIDFPEIDISKEMEETVPVPGSGGEFEIEKPKVEANQDFMADPPKDVEVKLDTPADEMKADPVKADEAVADEPIQEVPEVETPKVDEVEVEMPKVDAVEVDKVEVDKVEVDKVEVDKVEVDKVITELTEPAVEPAAAPQE